MSIAVRWRSVVQAIQGNFAGYVFWRNRPQNDFTRLGYEIIPDFLPASECARLVKLAARLMRGPSHHIAGNCYTWVKSEAAHGRNACCQELLNVNDIDEGLAALLERRDIQRLFEERLGESVEVLGFSIQHDGIDTTTKRGYHVDTLSPPRFKAFIYLTDVEAEGDGPFTIIPGSHRAFFLKFANEIVNAVTTGGRRDMFRFTSRLTGKAILAPAGSAVLSTQDAIHKGESNHWRRDRYALVAYATTTKHFDGRAIDVGLDFVQPSARSTGSTLYD